MDPSLVGRDTILHQARRALAVAGTVIVEGPAGIGKTAVWRTLVAAAAQDGWLVLSATPTESERLLPYAALADLLSPLAGHISELPAPQRVAAEVVLLSAEATDAFDERAAGAATRALLEAAVRDRHPVLVAVDDAPWLDLPSERALSFALRRLSRPPAVLLSVRIDGAETVPVPLGLAERDGLLPLTLTRLGVGALHHILRTRLDVVFSRPLLGRIAAESGGNPLLAIELARAVLRLPELPRPGDDLPIAVSAQQLLGDSVSRLPARTQAAVRLVALLTAPTLGDLVAAGVTATDLDPAEEAGMLVVGPTSIRFSHPMHAAAVRAAIPAGVRRRLQRGLAKVVAHPDERARQLARGTEDRDAGVAQELEEAAQRQRDRGAPDLAAELYSRAAELTPTGEVADLARRMLACARCRFDSGDHVAAQRSAAAADAALTGDARAEALLIRATVAFVTEGHPPAIAFASQALSVADSEAMTGRVHAYLCVFNDSPEAAIGHGEAALALLADSESDTELLASALYMLFYSEVRAGRPPRTELLDRGLGLESEAPPWLGGTVPAMWWTAVDDNARAAARLQAHLGHAVAHGDEPLQLEVMLHLVQLELLAGQWPSAAAHLTDACALGEQLGTSLDEENYLLALLALNRGELDAVGPVVQSGLRRSEELQDSWGQRVYGGLAGQIALAEGHFADAARIFGELAGNLRDQGLVEPLATRLEPDWIEACVGVGDLVTAAQALEVLSARHDRLPRPWTSLALARSKVLLAAAAGEDTVVPLDGLAAAMAALPPDVLPLDRARCLLAAGLAHRRARRKREAREFLTAALQGFNALGANAFAARTEQELARVGTRTEATLELTATESRVARLASQGRTNRVIAESLFISPKTVEANLARVYRKLGIASRAELGAIMGSVERPNR